MPVLDDLATFLDSQSTGLRLLAGTSGNLTKGFMPDAAPAPDTVVTLYETGGFASLQAWSTVSPSDRVFERPRVQVLSRSTSYETARSNAEIVHSLLDGLYRALPTSTGTWYAVDAVQPPFLSGRDENDRFMVSCNFDVLRRVAAAEIMGGSFSAAWSSAFDLVS